MKRFFFAATLVLVVMTLAVGVADMQLGRAQVRLNLQAGEGGGPISTCRPGTNCGPDDTLRQIAGEGGGPIPTCRPGTNCGPDDTLRQIAGEGGGPIPTCRPGTNCGPDDTLRQMAGEGGGPIPTCRPGTNCGPDDTLRQIAGHIVRTQIDSAYFFGESQERLAGLS